MKKVNIFDPQKHAVKDAENLAWLLLILDKAAKLLREGLCDGDAAVLEAHRAQLVRGRNWPGDPIELPGVDDEKPPPKRRRPAPKQEPEASA